MKRDRGHFIIGNIENTLIRKFIDKNNRNTFKKIKIVLFICLIINSIE